jgi:hypothetical protein
MCVSEFFSGIRWLPIVALASLVVGLLNLREDGADPGVGGIVWMLGWSAVALWFAFLAAKAREDR